MQNTYLYYDYYYVRQGLTLTAYCTLDLWGYISLLWLWLLSLRQGITLTAYCTLDLWGSSDAPTSASNEAGTPGMHQQAQVRIFLIHVLQILVRI